MINDNPSKVLTVEEFANKFKVSKQTVYNWIDTKKIKVIRIGNVIRIPETEIPESGYKQEG